MKKLLSSIYIAIAIGLPGVTLAAPIISVDPTESTGVIGDTITVDILWDGLDDGEYLSGWDIDLFYDNTVLAFMQAEFGFGVDSFGCIPSITCDTTEVSPGQLDMFEVSLDDVATLVANQDALGQQFAIATISFEAIGNGVSNLSFGGPDLVFGDEVGDELNVQLQNGRVCIGPSGCTQASVPEPAAAALLVSGLILLRIKQMKKAA